MRPSFHCAAGWPWSAAYCSAVSALAFSSSGWAAERKPSSGVSEAVLGVVEPSKANAGSTERPSTGPRTAPKPRPTAMQSALPRATPLPVATRRSARLDIRIARLLGTAARMGHRAIARRSHLLGVFPQIAGPELRFPRLPILLAGGELGIAQLDIEGALVGIELDDVAVAKKPDRAADRGLGADMADAETASCTGETAIGNQRDLAAQDR